MLVQEDYVDSIIPQIFRESIKAALLYKEDSTDFLDQVMRELEVCGLTLNLDF